MLSGLVSAEVVVADALFEPRPLGFLRPGFRLKDGAPVAAVRARRGIPGSSRRACVTWAKPMAEVSRCSGARPRVASVVQDGADKRRPGLQVT